MTARRIVTMSGPLPPDLDAQIAAGRRPRVDDVEIARHADGEVLDVDRALADTGRPGRLIHRFLGPGALLAWAVYRRRGELEVVLTDGEHVGLPFAALVALSRTRIAPRHVMIAHVLSTRSKTAMIRWLRLARHVDLVLPYASSQVRVAEQLGFGPVELTTFMADARFFDPATVPCSPTDTRRPLVVSAGLERRDYRTLAEAIQDLDVDVVIAAASPWSRWRDRSGTPTMPDNVTVERYDLHALRDLYARAAVVVVPLHETDFQAGITTVLEAMAMGRPVVCTRTTGQTDTIIDGVTGRYVPPGDVAALREAIRELLADPVGAERMGMAAREWLTANADIDDYAVRLAGHMLGPGAVAS